MTDQRAVELCPQCGATKYVGEGCPEPHVAGDYPFPGCCPHSPNAHTRNHCLACACVKPPARIDPPPQPEPAPTFDVDFLRSCVQCGALLLDEDREKHIDWHQRELDRFESITIALAHLEMELRKGDPQ